MVQKPLNLELELIKESPSHSQSQHACTDLCVNIQFRYFIKNFDCTCPSKSGTIGEYAYIGIAIFLYE